MNANKLEIPLLHSNGSGSKNLLEDLEAAHLKVREACEQLAKVGPHPRDYYISKDPEAYTRARDQHCARLQKLLDVKRDLEEIAGAIWEQKSR